MRERVGKAISEQLRGLANEEVVVLFRVLLKISANAQSDTGSGETTTESGEGSTMPRKGPGSATESYGVEPDRDAVHGPENGIWKV